MALITDNRDGFNLHKRMPTKQISILSIVDTEQKKHLLLWENECKT